MTVVQVSLGQVTEGGKISNVIGRHVFVWFGLQRELVLWIENKTQGCHVEKNRLLIVNHPYLTCHLLSPQGVFIMKLTTKLLEKMHDPAFQDTACDNAVLRYHEPRLVADIYKEHVRGWVNATSLSPDAMVTWKAGMEWLRSLEDTTEPRLFHAEECLDKEWWETQCAGVVSRRATSRRLKLPLGKEIDVCTAALLPHGVVWLLELVGEKHLELAMHPKSLLQHLFQQLRKTSTQDMKSLFTQCHHLYPKVKHTFVADEVKRAYFNIHLSHWPGLRLCPPFFPDLIALQPAPSLSLARSGKYVILHASTTSYATTNILDATTCSLEETRIAPASLPPIRLRVVEEDTPKVADILRQLHGMHPRSFPPTHPASPFVAAAKTFTELVDDNPEENKNGRHILTLPEHPLDNSDTGFSFTYMLPSVLDDTCVPPKLDEHFYQIEMTHPDENQIFYISPYIGWGLRLRQTLLAVTSVPKGRGVCIVIPENADHTIAENLLLTAIGWLTSLGLSDVKLVTEGICQKRSLQSRSADQSAAFASIHDGYFVCHTMDTAQQKHSISVTTTSIQRGIMDKLRRHLLDHAQILQVIQGLTVDRYKQRTKIIEQVTRQLMNCLENLDRTRSANMDKATCPLQVGDDNTFVNIEVSIPVYDEWMTASFESLSSEPWWGCFNERLEKCRGIVLSGGVFDYCPSSALSAWTHIVGPNAKTCTTIQPSLILEGACLHIHSMNGQREMVKAGTETRVSIPPHEHLVRT